MSGIAEQSAAPRYVVIGGGISGLAAALRLRDLAPDARVTLLEAGNRLGGSLFTERIDGFLVEHAADMFITSEPEGVELAKRVCMEDELIGTSRPHLGAWIRHRGRLSQVPPGFQLMAPARLWPVVKTALLSPWAKARLACEPFVPPRKSDEDESLQSFISRRMGRQVYDRLVEPLASGIYMADGGRLSMAATFPRFWRMEKEHGSLYRAMRRASRSRLNHGGRPHEAQGARYGLFVTPRRGMSSWVEAIAAQLPSADVRLQTPVAGLQRSDRGRWQVTTATGDSVEADGVVLALPAYAAAGLLHSVAPSAAQILGSIEHPPSAVVAIAARRDQIRRPLNAFGYLVPQSQRRWLLACSFSSLKFAGRAPEDSVLMRVFVGGAVQPELVSREDTELVEGVLGELREDLGFQRSPEFTRVIRYPRALPQYEVGHLDRMAELAEAVARLEGLALAGNMLEGVGIPYCIRSGYRAAERLVGKAAPEREATS